MQKLHIDMTINNTVEEHVYPIDNRKQGFDIIKRLRAEGAHVGRYTFHPSN